MTSDDLDLPRRHQMFRKVIGSIQDTIRADLSAFFQFDTVTLPGEANDESKADLYTIHLYWVDWFESIHFPAKLSDLIQFLFQVSWLVTESIPFHKVGDWVD